MNKFQGNLNQNAIIFIQEYALKCYLQHVGHVIQATMCSFFGTVMYLIILLINILI